MNTTYFLNQIMGNIFRSSGTPAFPRTYYIGLSASAPAANGGNVLEPSSDAGYKRIPLSSLSSPQNGVIKTAAEISFPKSTDSWGKLRYFVVYDALTGGNLLFSGKLERAITVDKNTTITFLAEKTILTLRSTD